MFHTPYLLFPFLESFLKLRGRSNHFFHMEWWKLAKSYYDVLLYVIFIYAFGQDFFFAGHKRSCIELKFALLMIKLRSVTYWLETCMNLDKVFP
jgi:hypothetical protein